MKLILTGGGDSSHFKEVDEHFIKQLGKNPALLYIPLARTKRSWKSGHKRIIETFSTISFDNIEMCLDLGSLSWEYLKSFNAIYIDGGNTFQLMDFIRETHAFELLHRFLNNGGVINGDSAGAIILGSHIETAHFGLHGDENKAGIISYQGLNILGNLAIHCHYQRAEDKEIKKFVKDYGFPVLALHEASAVSVNKRRLKVFGKRSVALFREGKVKMIKSGDTLLL